MLLAVEGNNKTETNYFRGFDSKDTKIIFKCLGSGHGCGLSQVGAVVKAIVEKKNCLEILKHYFADERNQNKISLKSLKDVSPKLLFKN